MQIKEALILMAGAGSRLGVSANAVPKPLVPVNGRPLISYTLDALEEIGVARLHVVVGANAAVLVDQLRALVGQRLRLNAIPNPEWKKQNGVSVLQAAGIVTAPFFLAMADHLFEPSIWTTLVEGSDPRRLNLAIDRKIDSIFDLDDAMKVATEGDKIVAISKELPTFDAIDTGLFVCPETLFDYLRRAQRNGDCSLADGVRLMATEGQARAVDIGEAWWQDVDTPEMWQQAEAVLSARARADRSDRSYISAPQSLRGSD